MPSLLREHRPEFVPDHPPDRPFPPEIKKPVLFSVAREKDGLFRPKEQF
jgi:hypothetical protein